MKKILTFFYENIEITAQVLSIEVEKEHNNLQNHVSAMNCQIMIKNEEESKNEGNPCYMFVASIRVPFSSADPNNFIDVKELDTEIFVPAIQDYVLNSPNCIDSIKLNGSILGLCEPPERVQFAASKIDRRKADGGLLYNDQGIAIMEIK